MTRTIAIHQPEYFPWLGFLDKAKSCDVFVLLDSVQFDRSSLQHRAKVLGPNGVTWLTIPFVHKFPQRIDEVSFADPRWSTKHWKTLQASYGRAAGWKEAAPRLEAFFAAPYPTMVDATVASVQLMFDVFGVKPPQMVRASALEAAGHKAELVRDIVGQLGGTRYLSGRTGATYLEEEGLGADIEVVVQSFTPPEYARKSTVPAEELRGVSALDAWLNLGSEGAAELLNGSTR